jgi:hypothetical protein
MVEDPIEKKVILDRWLSEFRLSHQKLHSKYHSTMPALKDQVVMWLEEEICKVKESRSRSAGSQIIVEKLPISLSVAQLAYFYKVLFDIGTIPTKNQKEIARFLAANFKTSKTDSLSVESLNSKYYNVEESTKAAVKDLVIKMLNTINRKN